MKQTQNLRDIRVDLHMHTEASDGTWKPERLMRELVVNKINIFAVTDHNSVENVERASELAEVCGMTFIPGVEVDVTDGDKNYHVLGYGVDIRNQGLLKLIERNSMLMDEKDDESIGYLEGRGAGVSLSEYKSYINNRERGGWKALNYLIDKRLCTSPRDFFNLFSGYGNPFDKMIFAPAHEAVKTITDAGGLPVLAHPGASFYGHDYKYVVSSMIEQGIRGIECFHPENNEEITGYCLDICKRNNLLITGGSDCHGEFVSKRKIGLPDIRLSMLNIEDLVRSL